jgi:arylsulfatase A-like enzyme
MHSEYLRMAGYYTSNAAKEDYQFLAPVTAWDQSDNGAHWRDRRPGQPFFSIINLEVTHESRIWGKANDSLWVDPNLPVPVPPYLPDTEVALRDIRRMYSNIAEMDARVGEIMTQLEQDALLDSTVVFWYTDHGGPLPRQKRMVYDSGLRSPMIVRFPGAKHAGAIDEQLLSFIDLKPTILSLAGIEVPSYVDGRAFLGPFASEVERDYIHAAGDRFDTPYDGVRAVRDRRFKYIRHLEPSRSSYVPVAYREQMPIMQELLRLHAEGNLSPAQALWFRDERPSEELFDTQTDPHELVNLADDPALQTKLTELRDEADRWIADTEDMGLMPEADYLESIWPGLQQPLTAPPRAEWSQGIVSLSSATAGSSMGYRIVRAGETPSASAAWSVYTAPLQVQTGDRLFAIAHRIGFRPSAIVTATRVN